VEDAVGDQDQFLHLCRQLGEGGGEEVVVEGHGAELQQRVVPPLHQTHESSHLDLELHCSRQAIGASARARHRQQPRAAGELAVDVLVRGHQKREDGLLRSERLFQLGQPDESVLGKGGGGGTAEEAVQLRQIALEAVQLGQVRASLDLTERRPQEVPLGADDLPENQRAFLGKRGIRRGRRFHPGGGEAVEQHPRAQALGDREGGFELFARGAVRCVQQVAGE